MKTINMKVVHDVKNLTIGRFFDFWITDEIKADSERFDYKTFTWVTVESNTSQRYFVEHLKGATANDTVRLFINCMGGSVKEALGIYNLLRRCPARVEAYIDGFAASAASIIAMAARRVVMPRNTTMMVHNAAWAVYGNSAQLRKSADDLEILNRAMIQSYIEKAGDNLPAEKLTELLDGETWLSAEECMAYGLADEYAERDADLTNAARQYQAAEDTAQRALFPTPPAFLAAALAALAPQQEPSATNIISCSGAPCAPICPPDNRNSSLHNMLAALIN